MSKFKNKTTKIRIEVKQETYNLICDPWERLNYIAGSPYELSSHIYNLMVNTLQSMKENDCKEIKITASWE